MESPQHPHGAQHHHDGDSHAHSVLTDDDREASLHLRQTYVRNPFFLIGNAYSNTYS